MSRAGSCVLSGTTHYMKRSWGFLFFVCAVALNCQRNATRTASFDRDIRGIPGKTKCRGISLAECMELVIDVVAMAVQFHISILHVFV